MPLLFFGIVIAATTYPVMRMLIHKRGIVSALFLLLAFFNQIYVAYRIFGMVQNYLLEGVFGWKINGLLIVSLLCCFVFPIVSGVTAENN